MRAKRLFSWLAATLLILHAASVPIIADSPTAEGPPQPRREPPSQAPVPAAEAAKRMTLPEGFSATLFAAEPDVVQPIAFTIDPRGRLWVAECYSYPNWQPQGRDRILIFEDTDGDGHFDRRTVFWDKGANISGLTLGFGGVWVCAIPNLLFIPDRNGDDVPDGDPIVKLDGWDLKAQHNVFNALNWGPDGWLYGCNGILSNSRVGAPGTPDAQRVAMNCGVWRLHPTRGTFEVVAHGTTNPWGLDWDDYGDAFITNCVIPHLFRVVPGARFQRMFGQDFNPHAYSLMESCADHIHWAGGRWQDSRGGEGMHGEAGGGHAHAGAMVYLGDNWPDRYRNSVFMCNIHGYRVNHDLLSREGSGYVAKHGKDFLFANDEWFRGLELKYGPDGGVYLTDWCDTGECHENDADGAHRENGRIFKITYGKPKPVQVNLTSMSDAELVNLQLHKNDWYVRTARRLLQERAAAGQPMAAVHKSLRDLFDKHSDVTRKLRVLWALYATGGLSEATLAAKLADENEYVRAWAVRLLCDAERPSPSSVEALGALAKKESSPRVRLELAAALQRIPPAERWAIAESLVAHAEDAGDKALPLMNWYGIEPLVAVEVERAAALTATARIPLLRQYLARRIVLHDDTTPTRPLGKTALVSMLGKSSDDAYRKDILQGMREALRARKSVPMPTKWPSVSSELAKTTDRTVRLESLELSLLFNEPGAVDALIAIMMDGKANAGDRQTALRALVEKKVPGIATKLRSLLDESAMRGQVLRALATYDDAGTPDAIVRRYKTLTESERDDAVNTLASRPQYAMALLDAVVKGDIAKRDISTTVARQLLAFGNQGITEKLEKTWGQLRATSGEKASLLAKYKAELTPAAIQAADPARGRLVFNRTCLQCHKLYESGGDIGPDLTGSGRANLDYILENVLDPSSAVDRDYQVTTIATNDGRLLSGILKEQSDATVTIQTVNDRVVLDKKEIEEMKGSPASMMPEGLLEKLSTEEIRDLIAYLATKAQVPAARER
jgi:putative membrane-bound dehydrogenase-like protein